MQFSGMMPLQYAQSSPLADSLKRLNTTLGQPGAPSPAAPASAPAPMDISPAATNAGTNVPQPSIMDALKGMSPQGILDQLRAMSAVGQQVPTADLPGTAAFDGAGMLSGPSGLPIEMIAGA